MYGHICIMHDAHSMLDIRETGLGSFRETSLWESGTQVHVLLLEDNLPCCLVPSGPITSNSLAERCKHPKLVHFVVELAVDQYGGGIASTEKDLQEAAEERMKYLFNPANDAVKVCGGKACFTCYSGSRVKESNVPLQLLHRRLGHFDSRTIEKMVDHRAIDVTLSDRKMCECAVCKAVKATRRSVPKQREYERGQMSRAKCAKTSGEINIW